MVAHGRTQQHKNMAPKRTADQGQVAVDTLSHTLYVNNLNDKIQADTLKHGLYVYFSTYGDILDIVVKPFGKMRGQAHIVFAGVGNATSAMKGLQDEPFFDKKLQIKYAVKKSRIISRLEEEQVY